MGGRVPIQDLYHLSQSGAMGKFCSVSFYFGGISLGAFERNFGVSLASAFPDKVSYVLSKGLMEYTADGSRLQMTPKGKTHYSGVLALFYAPHVQEHLLHLPGGEENVLKADTTSNKPYVGVPASRYEYKPRKQRDPRPALSADWALPGPGAKGTLPSFGNQEEIHAVLTAA